MDSLTSRPYIEELKRRFGKGRCFTAPLPTGAARALFACGMRTALGRTVVWVSDGPNSLSAMHGDLLAVAAGAGESALVYPARDTLPSKDVEPDVEVLGVRLRTLCRLQASREPALLATSIQALMETGIDPERLSRMTRRFRSGAVLDRDAVVAMLSDYAYSFEPEVVRKGAASVRGGLIDVWSSLHDEPFRLEFCGDVLESIRVFDPIEQRSIRKADAVVLAPAAERPLLGEPGRAAEGLIGFLPADAVFLWSDTEQIEAHARRYEQSDAEAEAQDRVLPYETVRARVGQRRTGIEIGLDECVPCGLDAEPGEDCVRLDFEPLQGVPKLAGAGFEPDLKESARGRFIADLSVRLREGYRVALFFATPGSRERFGEMLRESGSDLGGAELCEGDLSHGCASESLRLILVAESDLYGYCKEPSRQRTTAAVGGKAGSAGVRLTDWDDIAPGDLVVHIDHGIGKYMGLCTFELEGRRQEVLAVEYADGARLYIPVSHVHVLSRYVGVSRHGVSLHKLGGKRWQRERLGAECAVRDLAAGLLDVQATREALPGCAFSSDFPWLREFEAAFPYRETDDQHQALQEVRADMEGTRPMDRLICGDVGYGKTEVAMRAAFRAVLNGKQVAVLVPTTVLAQQHLDAFTQRMAAYPVHVEMLSRFRSGAQRRKVVAGMAAGTVDIVIGTHGLLQPGIRFKDLGLVIIDEEQRFGVGDKEQLKRLRRLVDVLTLTATPIPRTLYMSLTGARDISTIQTPPRERLPVETIVASNTDAIVRQAILRELNRDGQAYYLHNRVMSIERAYERLTRVAPEARIAIAHGQMPAGRLANVMRRFVSGEVDVLLCSSIIESGLDIPNANTILIARADRFGMADLYQLRGRVGRSFCRAYAYLLLPPHGFLDETARKRIAAIRRYSHFGASFSLALRDLEIRGAGNLLGARQSGHIAAVGFGLYCQLLRRSVARLNGAPAPPVVDVELRLDFVDLTADVPSRGCCVAVLPAFYIEDERLRVATYRRIAETASVKEVQALRSEFRDRFGPIPAALERLLAMADIRMEAHCRGVKTVRVEGDKLMIAGTDGEWIMPGGRHPRLTAREPSEKLSEILATLRSPVVDG